MAIRVYQEGEHPSGFVGIRVTRSFGGKYRQRYFSFRKNGGFVNAKEEKALMREAEALEEEWKKESQQARYESRLSAPHPNTKPFRSVGVEGITAEFAVDNSGPDRMYYYPGFRVSQPGVKSGAARHIRFSLHGYTGAWKLAVEMWAEGYSILPKDKRRVLKNMPDPKQFAALRRQMNKEGHDIPMSALNSVYGEQGPGVSSPKPAPAKSPASKPKSTTKASTSKAAAAKEASVKTTPVKDKPASVKAASTKTSSVKSKTAKKPVAAVARKPSEGKAVAAKKAVVKKSTKDQA